MSRNRKHDFVQRKDGINPLEMIALEEELIAARQESGIRDPERWWMPIGDWIASCMDRPQRKVNRGRYLKLAITCGWFCGAHRFYAGRKKTGMLYLLFFWTGIPFAMTLLDLMAALPLEPDGDGAVCIS